MYVIYDGARAPIMSVSGLGNAMGTARHLLRTRAVTVVSVYCTGADTPPVWAIAQGSCGFNTGDTPIHGAYVNGVALFAWSDSQASHRCVVTGQMSCGGFSLDSAKEAGVEEAIKWGTMEADQRLSRKQFEAVMASTERLPYILEWAESE